MAKQTQAQLEAEVKSLKSQLKYYEELFKQRQARPILLPNDLVPSEFNWICQILKDQREKLVQPLMDIPSEVNPTILLNP